MLQKITCYPYSISGTPLIEASIAAFLFSFAKFKDTFHWVTILQQKFLINCKISNFSPIVTQIFLFSDTNEKGILVRQVVQRRKNVARHAATDVVRAFYHADISSLELQRAGIYFFDWSEAVGESIKYGN